MSHFFAKCKQIWISPLGALTLAALGAASCGAFVDTRVFALCAALLAVLILGVVWPWLSLVSVRGAVRFGAARVREGDSVEFALDVKNWLPLWGFALRGVAGQDQAFAALQPSQKASLRVTFQPPQRGEYPREAPHLSSGFPFGLWQARRGVRAENTLLVWPRTFEAGPLPQLPSRQRQEGLMFSNATGHGGDTMGVRDYQRGDSLRRIHWAQTARHDRLIVCEQQATQLPRVLIALDLDQAAHTPGAQGTREWAVRVGASLCESWSRQGAQIETIWGANGACAAREIPKMLDALARIPAHDDGTHDDGTFDDVSRRVAKCHDRALRVLVTTDAALARHPARLTQPGLCLVVLQTGAFGGAAQTANLAPGVPMIMLDDAQNVAGQLRRAWEAISFA